MGYIILGLLWFVSGAMSAIILTLYYDKDDYKLSDIPITIISGISGIFMVITALLFFLPRLIVKVPRLTVKDRIIIKRKE